MSTGNPGSIADPVEIMSTVFGIFASLQSAIFGFIDHVEFISAELCVIIVTLKDITVVGNCFVMSDGALSFSHTAPQNDRGS